MMTLREIFRVGVDKTVADKIPTDGRLRRQIPKFFLNRFAPKIHVHGIGRRVDKTNVHVEEFADIFVVKHNNCGVRQNRENF